MEIQPFPPSVSSKLGSSNVQVLCRHGAGQARAPGCLTNDMMEQDGRYLVSTIIFVKNQFFGVLDEVVVRARLHIRARAFARPFPQPVLVSRVQPPGHPSMLPDLTCRVNSS